MRTSNSNNGMDADRMIQICKEAADMHVLSRKTAQGIMDCIALGKWHESVEVMLRGVEEEVCGRLGIPYD